MAIISSFNNWVAILPTSEASVTGHFFFEDGSENIMAEPDEVTTTAHSWRTSRSELSAVESLEFSLPEDDTTSLDVLSVAPGTNVNIYVRRGQTGSGKFEKFASALYLGETKTIQPGRGRRVQLRFQHGIYTTGVAAPTVLSNYMTAQSLT